MDPCRIHFFRVLKSKSPYNRSVDDSLFRTTPTISMRTAFLALILGILMGGCAHHRKSVDSRKLQRTDNGFEFRFAMQGSWSWGKSKNGQYMVGRNIGNEGSSRIAIVRYGPVLGGASPQESLDLFERDLKAQASGERVGNVENQFLRKEINGAPCLIFNQTGKDLNLQAEMVYEGFVCIHPKKLDQFFMAGISHRSYSDDLESVTDDVKSIMHSLRFW